MTHNGIRIGADVGGTFTDIVLEKGTELFSTKVLTTYESPEIGILEGIENVKGEEINILDLRSIENVACKYFIICTGNSSTQVNAITSSVRKFVSKELSEKPWHIEGLENCKWVLIDYVDVVVHVFNKETREFYKLEELWEEAESTIVETKY